MDAGGFDGYTLVERSGLPDAADFCLTVTDDCMEPYIRRGERVCVQCSRAPQEFEVGVFMIHGRVLCRQWCEDYTGALHLLAANPARQGENLRIKKEQRGALLCLGRVLLAQQPPRPLYD